VVHCSSAPEILSLPVDSKARGKSGKASTPSSGKKHMSLLPKSSSGPCSAADSAKSGGVKSSSASSLSSPKPKRNLFGGFKQTLKGKNYDGAKSCGREKERGDQKCSPVNTPVSASQSLTDSLSALSLGSTSSDDFLQVCPSHSTNLPLSLCSSWLCEWVSAVQQYVSVLFTASHCPARDILILLSEIYCID